MGAIPNPSDGGRGPDRTVNPMPFHRGELQAQALAGAGATGAGIRAFMPDQHRSFFGLLPTLFVAVPDRDGWPLATVLAGPPGFVASPDATTLRIDAGVEADDPVAGHLRAGQPIGLLGLQFETRRRNRANGIVTQAGPGGITVAVAQSFGNCAKYIQTRAVTPGKADPRPPERLAALDRDAADLIAAADTFFIASGVADPEGGGMDISHRGGRPGFVRVSGDALAIPDFAGNRFYNTFGNLLRDPRAGLLFVDFARGDLLHLRGTAAIDWGPEAAPAGAERVWRFQVNDVVRRRGALPLRFAFVEASPATLATGIW
ncbi:MAG TPA: pyridoxamine 5'-phosphate oxidase family protein [Microvirga sp.]|jgi:hypothetical protein|nr:pyridoxamine 5'-phosphate oxidase family protein [Microvirga sp.]